VSGYYDIDIVFDPSTTSAYDLNYSTTFRAEYNSTSGRRYVGACYTKSKGPYAEISVPYGSGRY
jgi:hypothetical protein